MAQVMRKTKKRIRYNDNVLAIYLKEINKISLLTRKEEVMLAKKAANGDSMAKDQLIKANLRFVVNIAKIYQNQGLPLSDLINEGNIGLIKAIDKFDVDRGYHFISYAVWWVRQVIKSHLRKIKIDSHTLKPGGRVGQDKKSGKRTGHAEHEGKGAEGNSLPAEYEGKADFGTAANIQGSHIARISDNGRKRRVGFKRFY